MSIFVYPYRAGSASATALRDALGARMIRRENSSFRGSSNKIVINWGCSVTPEEVEKANVINPASAVKLATNKRTFFETVHSEVSIPEFTLDQEVALSWLNEGGKIVVRETLTGHSAEGLVMIADFEAWENYNKTRAKLYVKYIPKKEEYRVHVVAGEVADVQQKAMSSRVDRARVNWQVRNHANGFIYKREDVNPPEMVTAEAIKAVQLCGLHYGAVDVIWNNHRNTAYVLEVNTAPGLEGQTVDNIRTQLERLISEIRIDSTPTQTSRRYGGPAIRVSGQAVRAYSYQPLFEEDTMSTDDLDNF